jgi:hypothetical protein
MIVRGILIPRRPIIAGALAVPIGLSIVGNEIGPWVTSPTAVAVLTCSLWWVLPMLAGALSGAVVGVITGLIYGENLETYGDTISVVSTIITMLFVGMCVWLIKFL